MPALERPSEELSIPLKPRRARLAGDTDVLVVGGGPAGLGAALGAAAAGARVVLAERYSFLGGNATAALVMPLMSFHTQHPPAEPTGDEDTLLPTDHGPGDPVLAGALATLLERLVKAGGALPPTLHTGYVVPFDPELFKLVALDLLDEAGVRFLFHAFASDVIGEDRPEGVVFETKSGPVVVRAKAIVDCTGDGDIAARAGAPHEIGRPEDGLTQPMTLMFRMVEFEREHFVEYIREHPDQWRGVHGLWDLIRKAADAGELDLPREDLLFFATPHPREVSVNSTRVTRVLGTDVWDLTYAEWQSRRQMRQIAAFLNKHVPGFKHSYVAQSGTAIGVRETRRIRGDYELTADDVLVARKFDDVIARCTYPIDIHNPGGSGTLLRRVPRGDAYDIPLRSLLPRQVEGLLVAGRCISGSHTALSSYRVMPVAMATGQAAGVCAALAAGRQSPPRDVPHREVQRELKRQGANLREVV
ncbi:FAD dependent oxidoreductase [Sulfurifustis variabilis]|uniref:FAD dependent oxidoreductase n=1 Tax=Sulfurifustis variabilis TaxID=1675686 RepID=A0A1B4V329_9GAMM|nr:FAD-dependent oxidoreductase [Sulfurifustis variabilis]BAU47960.1 FAD dependent oxidoreductase [Sulfurifustis variabilis]